MKIHQVQNVDIIGHGSFERNQKLFMESRHTLPALLSSVSQYTRNMTTEVPNATPVAATVPSKKYTIEYIKVEDTEDVLVFLRTYFFKDEPLNTFLELGECKELEVWATACISEKCSFKAVLPCGEIIGIFLNGLFTKQDADAEPDSTTENCKHKKFQKILTLMDYIDSKFDLFQLYPEYDKALDGKIVCVNEKYRGMGIAKELTSRTIEYMQKNNIALYNILCTSQYSAMVCERLGFSEKFTLPYIDYVVNGENPLMPAEPHVAARIYVKKVD